MDPQQQPTADTTISALSEDLLREIFLRLPSLTSLVRAALACRAFLRAIRSCPVFRRRFSEHHPPQLMGFYRNVFPIDVPPFRPLRRGSDPDVAAAIRGADFFLTRLLDDGDNVGLRWIIRDCHDGYVLLVSRSPNQLAVYNPFTRAMDIFPQPPVDKTHEFHVLSSEEDPGSFRLVCIFSEGSGVRAAVLSSDTREWQISPNIPMDARIQSEGDTFFHRYEGTHVNGFIYLIKKNAVNARMLNIATLQFSQIDLPLRMKGQGKLSPGKTKDGKLCMVCTDDQFSLVVWLRRVDEDGVERWMLHRTFPLLHQIAVIAGGSTDLVVLKILTIIDGFVYLSLQYSNRIHDFGLLLCFCLETGKLNNLCPATDLRECYLYIMAWPPSLVFNKAARVKD